MEVLRTMSFPKSSRDVVKVYRSILRAAKTFPSRNKEGMIAEIKTEFRSNKDVSDPEKVEEMRKLAMQSLEQLRSWSASDSGSQDSGIDLKGGEYYDPGIRR